MLDLYAHFPYNFKDLKDPDILENINKARKEEYFNLYSPLQYDPACNDIQLHLLPKVISAMQLSADDILVDLGSSAGL